MRFLFKGENRTGSRLGDLQKRAVRLSMHQGERFRAAVRMGYSVLFCKSSGQVLDDGDFAERRVVGVSVRRFFLCINALTFFSTSRELNAGETPE